MANEPPRFHPEAVGELDEAAAWYGAIGPHLAERFLDEAEVATERLASYPEAYARIEVPGLRGAAPRKVGVHKFPYALVYTRVADGSLFIVAVAHQRREPQYWAHRLFLLD